jgi:hypothetical protein
MNTLRKYLDIISESTLLENPWEGQDPAKAQAWSALTPEDQKWLGGADPTDPFILNRAPNKGKPAAGAPTTVPGTGETELAQQTANAISNPGSAQLKTPNAGASADGNAGEIAAQTPQLKTPSAGASADGNAGELAAQANVATTPPAQSGQSVNRDSMTFRQAFKDALDKKEPKFTWKGKEYTTQLAPSKPSTTAPGGLMPAPGSKGQSGMAAQSGGPTLTPQQDAQLKALLSQRVAAYQRGDTASVASFDKAIQQWGQGVTQSQAKPATESVGYAEDQNLVSIVHLAGLR